MTRTRLHKAWFAALLMAGLLISSCVHAPTRPTETPVANSPTPAVSPSLPGETPVAVAPTDPATLLDQSWPAYKQRFIQTDGRVIDWEANARTVSEGQAYAMLRAVMADDPDTFAKTLDWAEKNLRRMDGDAPRDSLWSWLWGKDAAGNWVIQDYNFASDADLDAATALIFAARKWNRPDYLDLARTKIQDLWQFSTVAVGGSLRDGTAERRYFLPGPAIAFQPQPTLLKLNPSYLAPASFRLFAQVDGDRWLSLVDSSYEVLENSAALSAVGLPSDWVFLDTETKQFSPVDNSPTHQSIYSFDAYRVWWRVVQDAVWFNEPRAKAYLQEHLGFLREQWRSQQRIPARLDLSGQPTVPYESTAQYGMLYAAFYLTDEAIATDILQQKLLPGYQNGIWDNENAYYAQNLAWLGIISPTELSSSLLQP